MRYKEFLQSIDVHTHSDHLEDLILLYRDKGLTKTILSIEHILDEFKEHKTNLSIKFDGAPSLIFGYLGERFFVSTKALFNKEPKINFSDDDIDKNHPGVLGDKLKIALRYLPEIMLDKTVIYQCDIMFDDSLKKMEIIDYEELLTFQPNTIKYAVEADSEIGVKISVAKIGIAIHTSYTSDGVNASSIKLNDFNVYENMFKESENVWYTDTYHKNFSYDLVLDMLENARMGDILNSIKKTSIIWSDMQSDIYAYMIQYINNFYRLNVKSGNFKEKYMGFFKWIQDKKQNELLALKTEKGKTKKSLYWDKILQNIEENFSNISALFKIHDEINSIKLIILSKLDSIKKLKTFIETVNGDILVTKDEGYIISNFSAGNGVKLVDRSSFSTNNFSKNIKKGWQKDIAL